MRRRPEARTHVTRRVADEFVEVLADLPRLVAPGVVRVALLEADAAEVVHHRGLREGLREPDHLGVVLRDVGDQPLPELDGLRVRVVDAEDRDAVVDPHLDDATHLGVDAGRVVVEVERIDVLVLLRGVLRVGDRAVAARGEPLRVRGDPGVVGRALQRDVERHLEAQFVRAGDERVEVVEVTERRLDGVVTAVLRPDGVRRTRILRASRQRVVRALAVDLADRVDRGEVDDVETHVGDGGQTLGGGAQRARDPLLRLLVEVSTLGAGEELVPRARQRQLALDEPGVVAAGGDEVAQRQPLEHVLDLGRRAGRETLVVAARGVAQGRDGVAQDALVSIVVGVGRTRALEHTGALFEHDLDVDTRGDLDRRVVIPRPVRVAPALDTEVPDALVVGFGLARPQVEPRVHARHRDDPLDAVRRRHDEGGVDGVVTLAEHGGAHRERLVDDRLRRQVAAVDDRHDVGDGDAADAARCVIRARDGGCVRVRFGTLLLGVGRVAAGLGRGTRRGGRGGCAQVVDTGRRGSEI